MIEKGFALKDVAELLGCTRVYVGYLLSKQRSPGLEHALRIEKLTADSRAGAIDPSEWVAAKTGTEG